MAFETVFEKAKKVLTGRALAVFQTYESKVLGECSVDWANLEKNADPQNHDSKKVAELDSAIAE